MRKMTIVKAKRMIREIKLTGSRIRSRMSPGSKTHRTRLIPAYQTHQSLT